MEFGGFFLYGFSSPHVSGIMFDIFPKQSKTFIAVLALPILLVFVFLCNVFGLHYGGVVFLSFFVINVVIFLFGFCSGAASVQKANVIRFGRNHVAIFIVGTFSEAFIYLLFRENFSTYLKVDGATFLLLEAFASPAPVVHVMQERRSLLL